METPYRAVQFSKHDPITRPDLNQVVANYQWIEENTPRSRFYKTNDKLVSSYALIIAGRARVAKTIHRDERKVRVKFGTGFDPACRPAVTTGIVAQEQRSIHCTVGGLKQKIYPDATGFEINVKVDATSPKNDKIKRDFFVHWSAMGYRTEDMREFRS